jgi:apolipoprotein N-acyltransferase
MTHKGIFVWNGTPLNPWLVSMVSGMLLSLSFPPINASFLSFIGFLGLYHLVVYSHNWRHLALLSYPALLAWNNLLVDDGKYPRGSSRHCSQ